ncbi:MAG: YjbQ family protein [Spirochaetaceae bacterium]|nr:MAG: YjbQ family protein [Spirochaetaceae bacterium]
MSVYTESRTYPTQKKMHMYILDEDLNSIVAKSGIREGHVLVFVANVTAALTITEGEPGIMTHDLEHLFSYGMGAPYGNGFADGEAYHHHETWGCDNGASHLRSLVLGPSVIIPLVDGKPLLETWQNVVLVECDTRDRARKVIYQIQGE